MRKLFLSSSEKFCFAAKNESIITKKFFSNLSQSNCSFGGTFVYFILIIFFFSETTASFFKKWY